MQQICYYKYETVVQGLLLAQLSQQSFSSFYFKVQALSKPFSIFVKYNGVAFRLSSLIAAFKFSR